MTDPDTGQPTPDRTISVRYREAVASFAVLARSLNEDEWATPVPCTPGWTVRDVLSHVAGVSDDVLGGRVEGAATEPWTASQVARFARFDVEDLLVQWEAQVDDLGAAIESVGEQRPPFDCHSHEHDVRHAIGRPANRTSAIIADAVPGLLARLADVPVAIEVDLGEGTVVSTGQPDAEQRLDLATSRFEVFRSTLGRRTPDQMRDLDWSGDLDALDQIAPAWFLFGPSEIDIVE